MAVQERLREELENYKTLDTLSEIANYIEENESDFSELEKARWELAMYDYLKKFK